MTEEKARKQVGIHINTELWRKFRATCLEDGVQAGHKMEELIAEYLAKRAKKSSPGTMYPK
ncbi:hypothetical protein [Desulfonatronovibrio hydrogenovorans]|uniref:hypothetical protein n=1 Tax=Desulfonatronovibrio hydrogenovorans TaxID=53245 RepID=UPI00048CDE4E|nr:hypothetical protein [Desulfonatronovibrio hydrogenovorans]